MHSIHYSFFLALSFYAIYYLGMQTLLLKRGSVPRIGNNLCYGYSPIFVGFLALLHFIFLAVGFYGLLFGPFLGHWSLLISSLFLAISVYTFLWLRNLFCRIFLYKEGILLVYLDGRVINLGFSDLKEIKSKKVRFIGTFVYGIELADNSEMFLFHSCLMANKELLTFIEDRINVFRLNEEDEDGQ